MKDALSCHSQWFGYKYFLNYVARIWVVTPAVLAIAANPTAAPSILAAATIPELITYMNEVKILDVYLDQTLETAQKKLRLHGVTNLSQIRIQNHFRPYSSQWASNNHGKAYKSWKGNYHSVYPL
jgi:hypothetical protein